MRIVIDEDIRLYVDEEDREILRKNTVGFRETEDDDYVIIFGQKIDLLEEDMSEVISIIDNGIDKFIYLMPYEENRYKVKILDTMIGEE